ncbi:hypothetical protein CLV59_103493 [Chitinophaga dinghuensis]|uniref:Uncharacterized protein n=1 Tax=Chitinophaga dinghuensis TaxID=1539050 RepID=A0A327W5T8_9BACT|nr:TssN family type VI secretion system protein [Chitinophaga dinghuensis]RAJ83525.1 hypothetical protein CLV59_103493 [Chitinophaga dinghuensis]
MTYLLIAVAVLILVGVWLIRSALNIRNVTSLVIAMIFLLSLLSGGFLFSRCINRISWNGVFMLGAAASFAGGIVAVVCGQYGKWSPKMKALHGIFIIILGITLLLLAHCLQLYDQLPPYTIGVGLLDFLIPVCFWELWEVVLVIPPALYEDWYYPTEKEYEEIAENDMKDLLVIALKLKKNTGGGLTGFRARAPRHVTWGLFFYHFINDYNARHPEQPIDLSAEDPKGCRWRCYRIRSYWWPRVIDPNLPVYSNGIKENSIILCERIHSINIETCKQ